MSQEEKFVTQRDVEHLITVVKGADSALSTIESGFSVPSLEEDLDRAFKGIREFYENFVKKYIPDVQLFVDERYKKYHEVLNRLILDGDNIEVETEYLNNIIEDTVKDLRFSLLIALGELINVVSSENLTKNQIEIDRAA